jgi:hypothetical protein
MTKMRKLKMVLASSVLCGSAHAVMAQSCDLRLSELEAAVVALDDRLVEIEAEVTAQYQRFSRLESDATADPANCPDTLSDSRAEAAAMLIPDVTTQSDRLLACAQSFVARVAADIDRATITRDSQLIVRLGDIQQRVLTALQTTTGLAANATFWAMRQERLVAEHDSVSRRCEILSEFYD